MSFEILTKLFNFIKGKLQVDEENIIIKTIEIEKDCFYTIEVQINDNMYSIRHYEPLQMIQGVNNGTGYWYELSIFSEEKGYYEKLIL